MRRFPVSVLIISAVLYCQFSSGVDYSLKKEGPVNRIGGSMILETGKTEWNVSYGNGEKYTAKSEMSGAGYEVSGESEFEDILLNYDASHSLRSVNNSASNDSSGSVTNFSPEDIKFQNIRAGMGITFKNRYSLYSKLSYYSGEGAEASAAGACAGYRINMSGNRKLEISYEMNFTGDEEALSGFIFLSQPAPEKQLRFRFSKTGISSEASFEMSYSSCFTGDFDGLASDYINTSAAFRYVFGKTGSSMSAMIGSNLTTEFELPEIKLPYLYYMIGYENKLIKDKLDLLVGWDLGIYDSNLRNRYEFRAVIPEEISSDEIKENDSLNKLFVKLTYRY